MAISGLTAPEHDLAILDLLAGDNHQRLRGLCLPSFGLFANQPRPAGDTCLPPVPKFNQVRNSIHGAGPNLTTHNHTNSVPFKERPPLSSGRLSGLPNDSNGVFLSGVGFRLAAPSDFLQMKESVYGETTRCPTRRLVTAEPRSSTTSPPFATLREPSCSR
jgi:hypothetical protein